LLDSGAHHGWPHTAGWLPRKEQRQHGVSLSDHGEKVTWAGYWDERERKLHSQTVDSSLYGAVALHLSGKVPKGGTSAEPADAALGIFRRCRIYFDGRVDVSGGLSSLALGKLARLHGAEVVPRLTMGRTTHVVCTQLSGAKERRALGRAASRASKGQYYVLPQWIAQSVAAGRRLCERRFSVLAQIARDAGFPAPPMMSVGDSGTRPGAGPDGPDKLTSKSMASGAALARGEEDALVVALDSDDDAVPPTEIDETDEE